MYSWEINNVLASNNYNISSDDYLNIILNSPQLTQIIFKPYDELFYIKDDVGNEWQFTVYCLEGKENGKNKN